MNRRAYVGNVEITNYDNTVEVLSDSIFKSKTNQVSRNQIRFNIRKISIKQINIRFKNITFKSYSSTIL